MGIRRDKYFGERSWAKHHGIEDPSEQFLASVHKRNMWGLAVVGPLIGAVAISWFAHYPLVCAFAIVMLLGVFVGLYIASKA